MVGSLQWFGRAVISLSIAFPIVFLWIRVIVPILVKPFGVSMPPTLAGIREWREALQQLPPIAYTLVFGVLVGGGGMILGRIIMKYVDWKLFGEPWTLVSIRDLVYGIVFWGLVSVIGILFKARPEDS